MVKAEIIVPTEYIGAQWNYVKKDGRIPGDGLLKKLEQYLLITFP